jgi:hypothetical protein
MTTVPGVPALGHPSSRRGPGGARFVSLFWRLLVPNVAVLLAAGVVLWLQPANGRPLALAGACW